MSEPYLIDCAYLVDSENRTANENCKCTICHNLFNSPKACGNCLNHFCSRCIDRWQTINPGECPLCKIYVEMRAVPILKNLLSRLEFYCPHRESGCQQIVGYDSFLSHASHCQFEIVPCRFSRCSEKRLRKEIRSHQEHCTLQPVKCPWCKILTFSGILSEHTRDCEQRIQKCEICSQQFRLADLRTHNCPLRQVTCKWCEHPILLKDQSQHQAHCDERQVQCLGCKHYLPVRSFYDHQNTCLDYPIVCSRCNETISRKNLSEHGANQCIQNLYKRFREENLALRHENARLKEQMGALEKREGLLENSLGIGEGSFSLFKKDSDIYVTGKRAIVREHKKKRKDRYVFVEREPLGIKPFAWRIRVLNIKSEWFAVGLSEETNLYLQRRYQLTGHCTYLVSANGTIYSTHSEQQNQMESDFSIGFQDEVLCQYLPLDKILKVTNITKNKMVSISISTDEIRSKRYYPCICLRCGGDAVELIKVGSNTSITTSASAAACLQHSQLDSS